MRSSQFAIHAAGALGALAAVLPGPLHAQEVDADGPASGEIVVTAQRRNESIQSVPIAIQAIGGDDLADRGVRNPQDLAQFTPNVTIMSPAGPGSQPNITIRGIGLNDFSATNNPAAGVY